jgi:hypothetical protein
MDNKKLTIDAFKHMRNQADAFSNYSDAFDEAQLAGWQYFFDGVPVTEKLYKFARELKYKRPEFIFRPSISPNSATQDHPLYNALEILHGDDMSIIIGKISASGGDGDYILHSPNISNEKYSRHNPDYYTKMTSDFKRAMKNALTYLKPVTLEQLVDKSRSKIRNAFDEMVEAVSDLDRTLRNRIDRDGDALITEFRNMIATGYQPVTQHFRDLVDEVRTAESALDELQGYDPKRVFVRILESRVEFVGHEGESEYDRRSGLFRTQSQTVATFADLPQEIQDRINVLQITNIGDMGIKDVGARIGDNTYVVYL